MKYWIDFSGYVCVEAENEGESERKYWNDFRGSVSISEPFSDDVWEIEGSPRWPTPRGEFSVF